MELRSSSASQIAKFEMCNLWWWHKTVAKRPEPFTAAQSGGVAAHSQVEHFLKTGENVLGKIALAAQPLLPLRSEHLRVEWGLHNKAKPSPEAYFFPPEESLVTAAGLGLIGFMDALDSSAYHVVAPGEVVHEEGVVEVVDLKSTSNFKWAKLAADLASNTQMVTYGRFVAKAFPWAHSVRLSHVSFLTKGEPEARKESVVVPVDEINRTWEMAKVPLVSAMKEAARKGEHEVEGNLESCGAYGGCPHRGYCPAVKQSNSLTRMKANMGLLKNRLAPAAPAAVPPPATNGAVASTTPWIPPPPPVQPTAPVARKPLTIKDESTPAGFTAGQAIQGQQYLVDGQLTMFLSRVAVGSSEKWSFVPLAGGAPILKDAHDVIAQPGAAPTAPPPAPVAAPAPIFAAPPPPPAFVQAPPAPPQQPAVARDVGAPPPPPPLAPPAAPAAPEAAKRGPGRPKKSATPPAEAATQAVSSGTGIRLFIGAVPSTAHQSLDGYLNGILKEMQEEFGVTDIRCAPDRDSPLAFGSWRGVLASLIRDTPPPAGDYVVFSSGGDLMSVVIETLIPMCSFLVRAS